MGVAVNVASTAVAVSDERTCEVAGDTAQRARVVLVDGATSTCALVEGSEALVNQTTVLKPTTLHLSTSGSEKTGRALGMYSSTKPKHSSL